MAEGLALHEECWQYHFHTPNADEVSPCKLRIPSDPRRATMPCERGFHRMLPSLENGAAHEWEVSREELAFWESLPTNSQNALVERQYGWCFLCSLDMEMP